MKKRKFKHSIKDKKMIKRTNIFFKFVIFSLMLTLTFLAFPEIANATTYYVATDGTDSSPYDTWAKAATSIQTAVNAAENGDSIIVGSSDGHGAGTYTENVDVNKQLTIQSENGYSTTTVIAASANDHVFEVTDDNVIINGFSIYGATEGGRAGIYLASVDNCTIEDNRCGWDGTHTNYYGIYLNASSNSTINNNTASYNTGQGIYLTSSNNNNLTSNIANYNGVDGIFLSASLSNTLDGNTASNNTWDGIHIESSSNSNILNNNTTTYNEAGGIVLDSSSENNLTNNTTDNNCETWIGAGISLSSSSNNNTLNNNTSNNNGSVDIISGSGIGLSESSDNTLSFNSVSHNDFGVYLWESSNNTITSNTMNDNDGRWDGDGIMLNNNCSNNLIANNTMNNDPGDGIEFYNSSNNTITGNTLINSGAAMRINYYSSNNTITDNIVINSDKGIVLEEFSNYNFVSDNTVTGHSGWGFEFWENASYNTLTRNNISNNGTVGIWLASGSYNTIYLNDISNNTTANIFSTSSSTTWHSPTTIYYDYNNGTFHKGYLGNYYSDGTHTGSNGIGGTYTIANDNNDLYQLINTSDNYSLQAWWLNSDNNMYMDDATKSGGSVTISNGGTNIWIADQAALMDVSFSGNDTWTGQLVFASAPTNGHTFTVEIGSSTDGNDFTTGGPDATLIGNGSSTVFTIATDASAFTVSTGEYSALRITSNHAEYSVRTGGAWSYTSAPESSADYALPVELTSFTAVGGDGKVSLKWVTQSEIDNQGFVLERSQDKTGNYQLIASYENDSALRGAGNSSSQQIYTYIDKGILINGQTYWYKLIDVDVNGVRTAHPAISAVPHISSTDLDVVDNSDLPKKFALNGNYPNPFNPETTISFDIPETENSLINVNLSVYNMLGQRVTTLLNEPLAANSYEVKWYGKDNTSNFVPSGIYFYILKTSDFISSHKMMLIK
jgi:parallel beta-helix repeat protein